MSVYRFKVIIEDYEDLFREIEVKASQSFEDLHFAILKAFGFDLKHPASFFYSDDLWHMEDEIAFKDMPYSLTSNGIPMIATKLSQYIDDPHQRFIYIYQSNEDAWAFLLELVAVGAPASADVVLPRVVKAEGEAPKQYNPKAASTAKPGAPSSVPANGTATAPALNSDEDQEPDPDDLQEDQLFEQIETMGKSRKSSSLDLAGAASASEIPDGFVLDDDSDSGLSDNDDDDDQDRDDEDDEDGDDDDYRGGGRGRSGDYDQDDY
ncbi:MAG: IS1096 element passenger TnpR family protein [Bacteroidota bacterium]